MSNPRTKAIKIQTSVVKRIMKEKIMYEKESQGLEEKIEKMKADGKDEYDIKKMGEVLSESKMMGPDCLKRLKTAAEDLRSKLNDADDLADTVEFKEGTVQLKEADIVLA